MTDDDAGSVIDVYQRHGAVWAERRNDILVEASWLDRFCTLLPAGSTVLDIGCGSGLPIARDLIRRGFDVTGVDAAPTMMALFRRNLPGVSAHLAGMRLLGLGRQFGGLLAWDSFFHLSPDDQRGMFARFQTHAAPGAVLMFSSGPAEGDAIGDLAGEPLYHGSLGPDEYRTLLMAAHFDIIDHSSCGHRTIWLARHRTMSTHCPSPA